MEPYRWSPEIEKRVIALLRVGCSATVICEQVRCSERTARRLIDRWKSGRPLSQAEKVRVPSRAYFKSDKLVANSGYRWVSDFNTLSPDEREAHRAAIHERADAGWSTERIADRFKMRVSIVRRILAERDGEVVEDDDVPVLPRTPLLPWPRINASHDDWPADQPFEDCPKAIKADTAGEKMVGLSHVYRYTRNALDRQSYCSNASAWAAL